MFLRKFIFFLSSKPYTSNSSPLFSTKLLLDNVAFGVGSLEDMETNLEQMKINVTPVLVAQVFHYCRSQPSNGGSRRLLRFFVWCLSRNNGMFGDEAFNCAIRAFTEMKDLTAMAIVISELKKSGCRMDLETFSMAADVLVQAGKPEEAVHLFRHSAEKPIFSIIAIVHALCSRGHARKAEGVVWHHRDKLEKDDNGTIYRILVHGWCICGNDKEARRVLKKMKSLGFDPDLACYNDLLRCICDRNLKFNPSGLVSEASDLMMEMRTSGVIPTTVSFNILISCLTRARRVKEAMAILSAMAKEEVESSPDHKTYYEIFKLLYLTKRHDKASRILDRLLKNGVVVVEGRFFHGLIGILCGTENVSCALEMFEKMKIVCREDEMGKTYDLLVEKLCRNGRFEEGRRLFDDAIEKGAILRSSKDLLDPLKMKVFEPTRPCKNLILGDMKGKVKNVEFQKGRKLVQKYRSKK